MTPEGDFVPLLRMRGIGKAFGPTLALDDVSLELGRGEVRALLGENGAGKSTLVKILSGAVRPDTGTMVIEGEPYVPAGPLDGRRRGISMIYQELTLAPHLTVEANIMLGRELSAAGFLDRKKMGEQVREVLDFVHHPEITPEARVGQLGVGARQVVEIARALLHRARILVMDEPTSSLSLEDTQRLFDIVRKLKGQGMGILYISHFLEEVRVIADTYTVLRDGRAAGSGPIGETSTDEIIRLMVGQPLSNLFPRIEHRPGAPILTLKNLKGKRMAVPVSFDLRRGEILGIAGLIGSGRTEMLRALFGLDPAEPGGVDVDGAPAPARSPRQRIGQGIGLLSEDRAGEGLALSMSIADNVTLSRFAPYRKRGLLDLSAQRIAAAAWIRDLAVKSRGPVDKVLNLSGGNQQKVALARLLHQDASILLLDEPTRGIDVVSKSQIYEWIGRLAAQGRAVLIVSSYFPELIGLCDRIAVFHRGALVDIRDADAWDARSLMTAATVGRAA
jgi:ribose transport system ATP-binding protein